MSELPARGRLKQRGLRRISPWGIESARAFHATASALCRGDCYNLVLHKHLGDIVNTLAAKACFEEHYGAKLRVLVRPQHEFLMAMYGVDDYAVLDIDGLVKRNVRLLAIYFGTRKPSIAEVDQLENYLFQSLFACVPIQGLPFVCENSTNDFFAFDQYWALRWAANMGIEDCRLALPACVPQLSREAAKALAAIAPLRRIVLFAPEAVTAEEFEPAFWDILADMVHGRGFTIVVNSDRIPVRHGVSAFALSLSLADVVALGHACAYVFSLRSGLCDALVSIGARLYAFYPAMLRREGYGLSRAYAGVPSTCEVCIADWKVDPCQWEGIDCTLALQRHVDVLHRQYRWAGFVDLLLLRDETKKHLSRRRKLRLRAGAPQVSTESNKNNPAKIRTTCVMGIPVLTKTYHATDEGEEFTLQSLLSGLFLVREWADGSWQSFLLGIPLSSSNNDDV